MNSIFDKLKFGGVNSKRKLPPFWSLVEEKETCWLWKGPFTKAGYGFHGRRFAHRKSFEFYAKRRLLPKEEIHHICKVKLCVNPNHLVAVTRATHPDGVAGTNRTKTHCSKGHEFSAENTVIFVDTKGYSHRQCCICTHRRKGTNFVK